MALVHFLLPFIIVMIFYKKKKERLIGFNFGGRKPMIRWFQQARGPIGCIIHKHQGRHGDKNDHL